MAVGKSNVEFNIGSISLMIGEHKVFEKGQVAKGYSEEILKQYMKNDSIDIILEINSGKKISPVILWILQKNILKLILITEIK